MTATQTLAATTVEPEFYAVFRTSIGASGRRVVREVHPGLFATDGEAAALAAACNDKPTDGTLWVVRPVSGEVSS